VVPGAPDWKLHGRFRCSVNICRLHAGSAWFTTFIEKDRLTNALERRKSSNGHKAGIENGEGGVGRSRRSRRNATRMVKQVTTRTPENQS